MPGAGHLGVSELALGVALSAEQLLAPMAAGGLLRRKDDAYRYRPRTARLSAAADAFVAAFPLHRVAIISLIYSTSRPTMGGHGYPST